MALARTTRVGQAVASGFGAGAYTSGAFTPNNNSILVAIGGAGMPTTTFALTISDSLGGTWTQRASQTSNAGSWTNGARIWTRPVTTGASMTVSLDHGATSVDSYALSVLEWTGYDVATPVTGVISKLAANDGADSVTLTAAPVAADVSLGVLVRDTNTGTGTTTPGSTFTEIQDFGASVGIGIETEERTGSTSTTVDWVDVTTAGDIFRQWVFGINIKADASGITGTVAVTLGVFTPAASGTVTPPAVTGTVAVTLGSFTSSASGQFGNDVSGTVAQTLGPFTAAGTGTFTAPNRTGTVAVTLGSFTTTTSGIVATGLFPTTVSSNGRFLQDQVGNPWFGVGDTAWSLAVQLTTAEITQYLEDRASRGVNFVVFNAVEHLFSSNTPRWENVNGHLPFSGAAFQTSLVDAYWDHVEFIVTEALRLGITCLICPAYLGFAGSEEGWDTEVAAATNGQMNTYGTALVARFSPYPNIVWLIGHDQTPDATEQAREAALSDALQAGTTHLVTVGGVEQEGSAAWSGSGVDYDFDTVYFRNTEAPAQQTQDGWANSPVMPTGFFEGLYEGDGATATATRSYMWGPLCSGATYVFFGNNPIWNFEAPDWVSSGTWEAALDDEGSLDLGVFADFVASIGGAWAGMAPDTTDTFLTTGEGTGATRASARFDGDKTTGVLGVAYRPHSGSASLTFDLTEFTGVASVKIRKFDPSSAAYTTIGTFATSGTQAVSSLGTNAAGDGDWVLVFEQSDDRVGTVAVTLGVFAPTASGTSTPPAVTGTVAVTLATFVSAGSGTAAGPGVVVGTAAVTLAPFTSNIAGTSTPPAVTGTVAVTLGAFIALASDAPIIFQFVYIIRAETRTLTVDAEDRTFRLRVAPRTATEETP